MDYKILYSDIKSGIAAADTKLGIRIAVLGIELAIVPAISQIHGICVPWWVYPIPMSLIFLQMIIAGWALFPRFGKSGIKPFQKKKLREYNNRYYFNYIASFCSSNEYIEKETTLNGSTKIEEDLLQQIYENAKILSRKYDFFIRSSLIVWGLLILFDTTKFLKTNVKKLMHKLKWLA